MSVDLADISFAAIYASDVHAIEITGQCQSFLRKFLGLPQLAHSLNESHLNLCIGSGALPSTSATTQMKCTNLVYSALDRKMIFRHSVRQRRGYSGICCEARPIVHCRSNVCQRILWFAHAEAVGNFKQINARNVLKFPIYTHQVLVGPLALRIVGVRDIIGRGKFP